MLQTHAMVFYNDLLFFNLLIIQFFLGLINNIALTISGDKQELPNPIEATQRTLVQFKLQAPPLIK